MKTETTKIDIEAKVCAKCRGKCCRSLPGVAYPSDFKNRTEIKKAIMSGKWAIDWWVGDPGDGKEATAYFVRPATTDKLGKIYDPSWGGQCIFLKENGCELKPKKRPKECRELKPNNNGSRCITHNNTGKQTAAIAWRSYYELLNSFHGCW